MNTFVNHDISIEHYNLLLMLYSSSDSKIMSKANAVLMGQLQMGLHV